MMNKPAILFLLPDARLRDIYIARFERDGWVAESASNLTDAERRAVQLRPDILFLHISFMDGVKAAFKHLRSLPTLLKTAIVVADTSFSRTTVEDLLQSGASEVVTLTQLTPASLVKRMNNLIQADV